MTRHPLWMVLAGAALAAASASASPQPRPAYEIVLKRLMFGPAPASLHVGDKLVWVNDDIFAHTATAQDGSFDVELKPGQRSGIVLTRAGAIPFVCSYHPGMKGVLTVKP